MKVLIIVFFSLTLFCLEVFSQDSINYSWRYYRPGNTGIQGDQATALWIDENGDPYIAAATGGWGEGGFAKFNQTENKWINFSNVDYPELGSFDNADVQILDIVEDYEKNLWMGNYTGAVKFNPQVGATSLENYNPNNSELNGFTYDIDIAPDSTIWFISDALVRFNPTDREWTSWQGSNTRIAIQPKPDGSYLVWSADIYFGYVFTYNSATNQLTNYLPDSLGQIAGLPGKDCVDDAGNFWALRMAENGDWETLEYQQPNGTWVYPTPPYSNVSFYIDAFKAFGNGKAVMVLTTGEVWMFDGLIWNNFGTWRPGDLNLSIDVDKQGDVWVCGLEGAAKRDAVTGSWQRYRITNTSQIDYFVEDISIDDQGNVWMTGNAGTGVGGFQKFDGERWTGFNQYTYGLGYDFPFQADNTQAIYYRSSDSTVAINPTFHGIHTWNGTNYFTLEDSFSTSKGFTEDSEGRLWSLGEYYNLRYFDKNIPDWIDVPIVGSGKSIIRDQTLPGTIWASTDYEILRTNGITTFSRSIGDFPGSAAWFTELAVDKGIAWIGTYSQFTSTGSTLIRLDSNTGNYTIFKHDLGWPFPGEHVYPRLVTPDGKLWLMYDSEYPSTEAGLCWYDGVNVGVIPSSPGGIPQWGGLPNSNIRELEYKAVTGGYELWMSCKGRGIAVLTVKDGTTAVENEKELPTDFVLSQNYPNPFNPGTKISWQSPVNSHQLLKVYDILGNEIITLVDEYKSAGKYEIDFNASALPSGIYFYQLQAGSFVETKKMILMK
ncbi:MAG: T9SS type A sorting domain-containing protein [Ignavibacteriaceae bacterium]